MESYNMHSPNRSLLMRSPWHASRPDASRAPWIPGSRLPASGLSAGVGSVRVPLHRTSACGPLTPTWIYIQA